MIQPTWTITQKDSCAELVSKVNTEVTSIVDSTREGNQPMDFYNLQCWSAKMVHGTQALSETTIMRVANL